MMPRKTTAGVNSQRGTSSMKSFKSAAISPLSSATPIPSIPTRTTPNGGNSIKFCTRWLIAQNRPSRENRLTALSRSGSGCQEMIGPSAPPSTPRSTTTGWTGVTCQSQVTAS